MNGGGSPKKIVIVRKKSGGHEAHHGGSWKVAYADFVTAMMAFFLVMWIMGMDSDVKDLVQGYFNNPVGFERMYSGGSNLLSMGNNPSNLDMRKLVLLSRDVQEARFAEVGEEIEAKIRRAGLVGGLAAEVEIVVTEEGLRIELMETGQGETFFDRSSAELKPALRQVLDVVGPELETLPNPVVVEGHTDALPFRGRSRGYTNWELSVDRANAARRVLQEAGLAAGRVEQVRGHADRYLKNPTDPEDPRNRRISILLPFEDEVADLDVISNEILDRVGLTRPEAVTLPPEVTDVPGLPGARVIPSPAPGPIRAGELAPSRAGAAATSPGSAAGAAGDGGNR